VFKRSTGKGGRFIAKNELSVITKAKELNLEFNQKTQIMPISEGVDFLGFRFYLTDTGKVIRRLRTSNKRRWKRRLKKYKEEYRTHNKSLEEIGRSVASYNGHLAHGHTWKLRKKVMGTFVLTHAPKEEVSDGLYRRAAGLSLRAVMQKAFMPEHGCQIQQGQGCMVALLAG